jgi:hypothetical protein
MERTMIENVVLVGGPHDGEKRACTGGDVLSLATAQGAAPLVYRRAHAESKFFRFTGRGA